MQQMSESKKKKLIRVQGLGNNGSPYSLSGMNFSFVSSPADGRRQASGIVTCREYVNRTLWAATNHKKVSNYDPDSYPPIDFNRLRLLVVCDVDNVDPFKRKLFNGKAALNLLEGLVGWKKSTITTVVHSNFKNAWLLTGPQEWVSQPQLLSLATWVLRLASFNGPLDVESYDHLEKNLFDLSKRTNSGTDTHTFGRQFWDKSYILVKHYKEIFGDTGLETAWGPSETSNFGVYSGFLTFCCNEATYSKEVSAAQKRFHKLCGEHLPRKNPLIKRR